MGKNTTIAIDKKVQKKLLNLVHNIEDETGKRKGYSVVINQLIDYYKEAENID